MTQGLPEERIRRPDRLALFCSMGLLSALSIIRAVWSYRTGFILPDEAFYYLSALSSAQAGHFVAVYPIRILYQLLLYLMFPLISNVFSYLFIGTIIFAAFPLATIFLVYLIGKELRLSKRLLALCLVLSLTPFVLPMLSAFMLTESPALAITMLCMYLTIKSRGTSAKILLAATGVQCLTLEIRETFAPYALVPFSCLVVLLLKRKDTFRAICLLTLAMISCVAFVFANYGLAEATFASRLGVSQGSSVDQIGVPLLRHLFFQSEYGLNIVLVLIALSSSLLMLAKRRWSLLGFMLVAVAIILVQNIATLSYVESSSSALLRYSFVSLPAIFLGISFALPFFFSLVPRHRRALAVVLICLAIGWNVYNLPMLLSISQTNLTNSDPSASWSVVFSASPASNSTPSILQFLGSYESQPLILYRYVEAHLGENILVIADPGEQAHVFLWNLRGVSIYDPPPQSVGEMDRLLSENFTEVLLFGVYYSQYWERLNASDPFYYSVLITWPHSVIEENSEGYLYRLV